MTPQAKCPDILEITLAAALCHRHDVVRIPQASAHAALQPPVRHQCGPAGATRTPQPPQLNRSIDPAIRTHASVAQKHLFAQIPRLRAQLPLMNAVFRAEGKPPRRHFERAPPAQATAIRAPRNLLPVDPSSRHHPRSAHSIVLVDCAPGGNSELATTVWNSVRSPAPTCRSNLQPPLLPRSPVPDARSPLHRIRSRVRTIGATIRGIQTALSRRRRH